MSETNSRMSNTKKNIKMGLINQMLMVALSFVTRTVFIHTLGVAYLGVSGLFSNILTLLSMADLGFGSAIVFSMYRPIAEKDETRLAALMNYYRYLYRIIAVVVAIIGFALVPFLPYIVNMDQPIGNLTFYYLMYLANTVMSYLFVYKTSITTAHQKTYLLTLYSSVFALIQNALQITVLLIFKNFTLYLAVQLAGTFFKNVYQANKSEKMYPYIKNKVELSKAVKHEIGENVKSMSIYKIGGVLINNTDNILISIMVGTLWVGYYSNYGMVVTNVNMLITILFNSVMASLGNLNATESKERQYGVFRSLQLASWWISAFCSICFFVLFKDFITLWIGSRFLLSTPTVIAIILNFYMPGTMRTVSVFRDTTGMFRRTKYVYLLTCVINLILSVLMGRVWGISGILFATILARLLTNFWWEPRVLMKHYFHRPMAQYFVRQAVLFGFALIALLGTYFVAMLLHVSPLVDFAYKAAVCAILPNAVFFVILRNNSEFRYLLGKLRSRS